MGSAELAEASAELLEPLMSRAPGASGSSRRVLEAIPSEVGVLVRVDCAVAKGVVARRRENAAPRMRCVD
jgi:hypothetical protein